MKTPHMLFLQLVRRIKNLFRVPIGYEGPRGFYYYYQTSGDK